MVDQLLDSNDFVEIKKIDNDKQIVYGEVYAPYVLDTHGEFMLPEDIKRMAHEFMSLKYLPRTIDTNHDQKSNGSYPIESFIARKGDPDYTEGAWVLGVQIADKQIWKSVKSGKLNGFSMQTLIRKKPVVIDLEYTPSNLGVTEETDGHNHIFYAELDESGRVIRGVTSTDNNHSHTIVKGTATEVSNGHSHRFFI